MKEKGFIYIAISMDTDKVYGIYTEPTDAHTHAERLNLTAHNDELFVVRRMHLKTLSTLSDELTELYTVGNR